jgi:signal transduction histidine kinase
VVRGYDGEACEVLADRNQLVQVFVNLVKNAMDAMPGGGTLTVTTGHRDGVVVIGVKDTGTGMTPDTLKRVFMPFFTTKDPGKGTGLGLSVSHSIIRGYEGRFYVESTPGRGSTFTIELPYLSGHA